MILLEELDLVIWESLVVDSQLKKLMNIIKFKPKHCDTLMDSSLQVQIINLIDQMNFGIKYINICKDFKLVFQKNIFLT